ncbi:hypothetical protein ACIPH4_38630 [Streptomyces tendae]|uniref:hypothetical protein n=1 Tax=Streptomyces tendae TaxID=1932 RepID=UPI00368AF794
MVSAAATAVAAGALPVMSGQAHADAREPSLAAGCRPSRREPRERLPECRAAVGRGGVRDADPLSQSPQRHVRP